MKLLDFEVGIDQPFFLIAGPCVIESEALALETATYLKKITACYTSVCTIHIKIW
jgi:2-dehydro-3-deoxyphosphooctonate aldolase (KDO 8-P synthase)